MRIYCRFTGDLFLTGKMNLHQNARGVIKKALVEDFFRRVYSIDIVITLKRNETLS
jgi:hypothetical protein